MILRLFMDQSFLHQQENTAIKKLMAFVKKKYFFFIDDLKMSLSFDAIRLFSVISGAQGKSYEHEANCLFTNFFPVLL